MAGTRDGADNKIIVNLITGFILLNHIFGTDFDYS